MSKKREMTMLIVGDVFVLRDDPPRTVSNRRLPGE